MAFLAACVSGHAGAKQGEGGRFIAVSLASADGGEAKALKPGEPARVTVTVRDPASGYALGGLGVATWIAPDDGESCETWYARLGRAAQTPEGVISLVGFDVIQVTRDNRVALVDPLLDLASANLKAVSPAFDAIRALEAAGDGQVVAVATGDGMSLRLGDPAGGMIAEARLPAAAHALAAAAGGFWAGLENGAAAFVDTRATPRRPVAIGAGPVFLATADDGGLVAVAQDGRALALAPGARPFALPGAVQGAALSPLAGSLFALSAAGDELFRADLDAPTEQSRHALAFPAARLAASPNGRWLALADAAGDRIAIFDVEAMRVRWTIAMPDPVIEMTFSDSFLYFMHRRQGGVTRVTFDPQADAPGLAAIAAGLPSDVPQEAGRLRHLVRIRAGGVLVASSREPRAYIVSESGAQAAMTMIPLRAGATAGVAVRQRGMIPAAQRGEYVGAFTAPPAGKYRAIVRTDAPALLQCQSFTVGGGGARLAAKRPAAKPAAPRLEARRHGATIAYSLSDRAVAVRALLMRADGTWRQFLTPVAGASAGSLPLPDPAPRAGAYRLYLEAERRDGGIETLVQEMAF